MSNVGDNIYRITDKYEPTVQSYIEILHMVNRRRRYRPSDFVPQTFIPDLDAKTR